MGHKEDPTRDLGEAETGPEMENGSGALSGEDVTAQTWALEPPFPCSITPGELLTLSSPPLHLRKCPPRPSLLELS